MTDYASVAPGEAPRLTGWRMDLFAVICAMLAVVAFQAIQGFPTLADSNGDNDSLMRLVEVRDLLTGQGWFDLHQYRMGMEGGFVMHWSRLVDAPIAAIIVAVTALTGSADVAETVARILWPLFLFGLTLLFIIRSARAVGGESVVLPAVVIGTPTLYFLGIYEPGALDHHNVQLMLTLASLLLLLDAPTSRWAALFSGVCAGLMLAVGMETAPYVAVIGICVAVLFILDAQRERKIARDFGLGFAGVSALVFFSTVPASDWQHAQCDAFSVAQFAVAALAGAGLAAIASIDAASRTLPRRLLSLGLLAVILSSVVVVAFPQCLAAPYADVDPRLRKIWLGHITETQSLWQLVKDEPASVIGRYVTPLLAIVVMALRLRGRIQRRQDAIVGAVLVMSFAVSIWQVRGSIFAITFAIIPLAVWIGIWRERAQNHPSLATSLRMIAVWLISANISWIGVAAAMTIVIEGKDGEAAEVTAAACERSEDYAALARIPDTRVLAVANIGASILTYTGHSAFAGLYHRNIDGNLLALDAFTGAAPEARAIVENHHIGLVALCPGNGESRLLAREAPEGLMAQLLAGTVPEWLEPVAETRGQPLELYRVRPGG